MKCQLFLIFLLMRNEAQGLVRYRQGTEVRSLPTDLVIQSGLDV